MVLDSGAESCVSLPGVFLQFSAIPVFPAWFQDQVHSDGPIVWWFAVGHCWCSGCAGQFVLPAVPARPGSHQPLPLAQVLEFLCSPDDDSRHSERQQVRAFRETLPGAPGKARLWSRIWPREWVWALGHMPETRAWEYWAVLGTAGGKGPTPALPAGGRTGRKVLNKHMTFLVKGQLINKSVKSAPCSCQV